MKDTFRQIFQNDYPGIQAVAGQIIRPIFKDDFRLLPIPENIPLDKNARDANIVSIKRIGYIEGNGVRNVIEFFDVAVSNNSQLSRSRVNIQACIRSALFVYTQAFMIFHYENPENRSWRFSYARKQSSNRESTDAKRYTYLFGRQFQCRTASERFEKLHNNPSNDEAILDAFSVETLNKEFFDKYKAQYAKFVGHIGDTKPNRDYVKKLLGRLVFLQFLQRKGWMGVPAEIEGWNGGDKSYLTKLIIKNNADNDRLLSDVLEPLFFDTLDKKRNGDIADTKFSIDGKQIKIPYLNGGLFDKDNADREDIDFPYSFFKGLIEFFDSYNFTIDENDPDDSEIGIDPEMLGHIFENLLEDNKDKGAFYTPKEIVQYMCRESVIQYLKTKQPDERYAEAVEHLIRDGKVDKIIQNRPAAKQFIKWLSEVKVCDPAIGSGAFPMGVLNVLYRSRQLLYGFTRDNADFSPAEVKREIIQNNIYGVDIEQGAVDIARLRFWLSLVVDETAPQPLPNLDYKIMCGNSLLSRYALDVPLDDVFVEYNKTHRDDPLSLARYKEKVTEYTNISDHVKKADFQRTIKEVKEAFKTQLDAPSLNSRRRLEAEIQKLSSGDLFDGGKRNVALIEKKRKQLQKKLDAELAIANNQLYADAFEWRFEFPQLLDDNGNFTGFDIVIANPPYLSALAAKKIIHESIRSIYKKKYKSANGAYDLYCLFIEQGLNLLCDNGNLQYITPSKYLSADYAIHLRTLIAESYSLDAISDYSQFKVFESAGVSTIVSSISKHSQSSTINCIKNIDLNNKIIMSHNSDKLNCMHDKLWGFLLDSNIHIFMKIQQQSTILESVAQVNACSTAHEAEVFEKIVTNESISKNDFRYVNNGTINRFVNYWGIKTIKSKKLITPYLPYDQISERRQVLFKKPKLIFCKLSRYPQVFYDEKGIFASANTNMVYDIENYDFHFLLAYFNSKIFAYTYQSMFGGLTMLGVMQFQAPQIRKCLIPIIRHPDIVSDIITLCKQLLSSKSCGNATQSIEKVIDYKLYKLYELTYDEIKLIDPETPITREEYEE